MIGWRAGVVDDVQVFEVNLTMKERVWLVAVQVFFKVYLTVKECDWLNFKSQFNNEKVWLVAVQFFKSLFYYERVWLVDV